MGSIVASELDLGRLVGASGASDQESPRILQLSSWIMVLGTVRLVCAVGDYASAFLVMNGTAWPRLELVTRYLQENSLPILLATSWPLLLGLGLRRIGGSIYLAASALTFLVLSLGGILQIAEGLSLRHDPRLVIGSFTVFRYALLRCSAADLVRASMGTVQLTLELATAGYACSLAIRAGQRADQPATPDAPRRRLRGRLAVYFSLGFLVLSMRMPLWTGFLEILNRSSLVRDFVLSTAPPGHHARTGRFVVQTRPEMEREIIISNAARLASMNRVSEAIEVYRDVLAKMESAERGGEADGMKGRLALVLNNLAWTLATCEDVSLRKPNEAVAYAQRATRLAPDEGNYWNTLGAVYVRLQDWDGARRALGRSLELRGNGGDAFDWFFLAIIDAKQGKTISARDWYDKAVNSLHDGHQPGDELDRFQVEAAEVLGLPRPPAPVLRRTGPGSRSDAGPRILRPRLRPDMRVPG